MLFQNEGIKLCIWLQKPFSLQRKSLSLLNLLGVILLTYEFSFSSETAINHLQLSFFSSFLNSFFSLTIVNQIREWNRDVRNKVLCVCNFHSMKSRVNFEEDRASWLKLKWRKDHTDDLVISNREDKIWKFYSPSEHSFPLDQVPWPFPSISRCSLSEMSEMKTLIKLWCKWWLQPFLFQVLLHSIQFPVKKQKIWTFWYLRLP